MGSALTTRVAAVAPMRRVLALGGGDAAGAEADEALAARVVVAHAAARKHVACLSIPWPHTSQL